MATQYVIIASSAQPYGPNNLGTVINTIMADAGYQDPDGNTVVANATAGIGWTYDGSAFYPPPMPAASVPDLLVYAQRAFSRVLGAGRTFDVNQGVSEAQPYLILCDGTPGTIGNLTALDADAQANASEMFTFTDNNWKNNQLSSAQMISLATQAGNWAKNMYPSGGNLMAQINAMEITTTAAIDAWSWPTS